MPPVSLKKGGGGMPLEGGIDFFASKNKGAGMAAAFKEFDDLENSHEEKKEDSRSFQEILREKREKTEAALNVA